jgi:hypothetical protein
MALLLCCAGPSCAHRSSPVLIVEVEQGVQGERTMVVIFDDTLAVFVAQNHPLLEMPEAFSIGEIHWEYRLDRQAALEFKRCIKTLSEKPLKRDYLEDDEVGSGVRLFWRDSGGRFKGSYLRNVTPPDLECVIKLMNALLPGEYRINWKENN